MSLASSNDLVSFYFYFQVMQIIQPDVKASCTWRVPGSTLFTRKVSTSPQAAICSGATSPAFHWRSRSLNLHECTKWTPITMFMCDDDAMCIPLIVRYIYWSSVLMICRNPMNIVCTSCVGPCRPLSEESGVNCCGSRIGGSSFKYGENKNRRGGGWCAGVDSCSLCQWSLRQISSCWENFYYHKQNCRTVVLRGGHH